MSKIIQFSTNTESEINKIKNLSKVLVNRFEECNGNEHEVNILLQEIQSLKNHLNSLEKQILSSKKEVA